MTRRTVREAALAGSDAVRPRPSRSRVARGRATSQLAAAYFREHGWPYAQAKTGADTGQDIDNMPGLSPEVKATHGVPLLAALRQAKHNAGAGRRGEHGGALPFVVWRPDGYGGQRIDEWVMAFTVADGTRLLRDAGYGDPNPTTDRKGTAQ